MFGTRAGRIQGPLGVADICLGSGELGTASPPPPPNNSWITSETQIILEGISPLRMDRTPFWTSSFHSYACTREQQKETHQKNLAVPSHALLHSSQSPIQQTCRQPRNIPELCAPPRKPEIQQPSEPPTVEPTTPDFSC